MPGVEPHEVNAPLEAWAAREARLRAERVAELAARERVEEAKQAARLARLRAVNCDNGHGFCLFCGVKLGRDDETGAATHEANTCPGPPRTCDECGTVWALDRTTGRYNPACTASDHEHNHQRTTWQLATRVHNPLALPTRVHRNDEDDEP